MKSSYLKDYEEEMLSQMQQELEQTAYAYDYKITSLNRSRPEKGSLVKNALPGGIAGIAGLAISAPVAIGLGLTGMAAKHLLSSADKQGQNEDIDSQIQQVEQQKVAACQAVEAQYKEMIRREKDRYLTAVRDLRVRFAGSTAMRPLISWLAERFEYAIRQADRRRKTVCVEFAFGVREDALAVLRWDGSSYKITELFEFAPNGFRQLPEFDEQVGFSHACARLLRFEIACRFPKDPCGTRPKIEAAFNDDLAELCYQAATPQC